MITPALSRTVERLARPPRSNLWVLAVVPRLDEESGAALVEAVAPRAALARGELRDLPMDSERWWYVVRWAERWPAALPETIGKALVGALAWLEKPASSPPEPQTKIGAALPGPVPRATLLLDATKSGKLLADAIGLASRRPAVMLLESQLGVAQLEPNQDNVLRMPRMESRGALRACSERLVIPGAEGEEAPPWAADLRGRVARPEEIEAGAERALGVGLWWLLRATGDRSVRREPQGDPDVEGRYAEEEIERNRKWMLGM